MTKEVTDRIFNAVTSNGCRDMDEVRFHAAINEALEVVKNCSIESVNVSVLEFNAAITLLRDLSDLQNGPPLERYRKEWDEVMNSTYDFLEQHSG